MAVSLEIDPEWNIITRIRRSIENDETLKAQGNDFVEAATVCAIELVENALKYAEDDASKDSIVFSFGVENGYIVITVTNHCTNESTRKLLRETIDSVNSEANSFELYVKRMSTIHEKPDGHSRLGLYRIAFETHFSLDYQLSTQFVTVTAKRPVESKQ